MITISERCYCQDQSWWYERIVKIPTNRKLKVEIRRNAYDVQSYAKVEIWSGTKWEEVVKVPITLCECQRISYASDTVLAEDFHADANRLLNETLQVVD